MTDSAPRNRRSADAQIAEFGTRLTLVERDVRQVLEGIPAIHIKLDNISSVVNNIQSEPQQSPLGRSLLEKTEANKRRLDDHERELDALGDWKSEMVGAAKLSRIVQTLLAITIALITLYQIIGNNRPP